MLRLVHVPCSLFPVPDCYEAPHIHESASNLAGRAIFWETHFVKVYH